MQYHRKIIISGAYVEYYQYGKVMWRDFKRVKKEKKEKQDLETIDEEKKRREQTQRRKDAITRTRTKIRRLVQSNPDLTKFVTLTFKENITDITLANKHFDKFIMRLNHNRKKLVKYLCVIEFQKRGAVHYHFLCNLPYIENASLQKKWRHGFVRINQIKHVDNLGAYVCKYLNKDANDKRLFHRKKFFYSRNLDPPVEVYEDGTIENLVKQYDLESITPQYEKTFRNEYTGEVLYKSFKMPFET